MTDLFQLKREFLEYCELDKGQSTLTIQGYERYLDRFLNWLKNHISHNTDHETEDRNDEQIDAEVSGGRRTMMPEDITQEVVRQYKLYINRLTDREGRGLKRTTQNYHMLALRSFLRYLAFRGISSLMPEKVAIAKTGDREVTFLETDEIQRILDASDTKKITGVRDRTILEVLFSTGMRVSELAALDIDDINFERGEIAVLGKGKKLRVVFLSDSALYWIDQYIKNCRMGNVERRTGNMDQGSKDGYQNIPHSTFHIPLFVSPKSERLTVRTIERIVEKASKKAGITKHVSPHTLRHSFATDLLVNGADVRSVQSLLGHSSITTTQVYTHVTDKHLREIHQAFHGRTINKSEIQNPKSETNEENSNI